MDNIKETVKEKYGQAALRVASGTGNACCGSAPSSLRCVYPITSNLYDYAQTGALPEKAVLASLGSGNPTAAGSTRSRRNGVRPRIGRQNRCVAVG